VAVGCVIAREGFMGAIAIHILIYLLRGYARSGCFYKKKKKK